MRNKIIKRITFGSGNKDLFAIVSVIVLGAGLFCFYWYILRHDPIKDAKRLIEFRCNCNEIGSKRKIVKYQEFLKTFDEQHFKKQQLAKNQYQLLDVIDDSLQNCIANTNAMYNALRSNYLNDFGPLFGVFRFGSLRTVNECFSLPTKTTYSIGSLTKSQSNLNIRISI